MFLQGIFIGLDGEKMKVHLGPQDILFPVPAALIVCGGGENHNIITVAWIGIMGSSPPVVGISLKNSRYSLDLIRDSGEFTVNIPPASLYKETDFFFFFSGESTDKFEKTGLTKLESSKIDIPIIKECPYNMECEVLKEVEVGDWVTLVSEIVETHIDKDKLKSSDKKDLSKIDISKVNPLVYCATIREYWNLGKKIGKGFKSGKDLKE